MPICHDKKFIFFHIPRCAGTSFEDHFQLKGRASLHGVKQHGDLVLTLHHLTAVDLLRTKLIDDDTLRAYFKLTVIRDPFDRMASDFYWQKRWDRHNEFAELDFRAYLNKAECIIRDGRYYEKVHYDHFRPMADYCVHDGELLVDDILLLEDIDDELIRIRGKIGAVNLPHKNASRDYEELRTTENLDLVYKLYACDKILHDNVAQLLGPR